ncbi:hypothetical protein D9611_003802 [Ephemerocybe angulata]|uniref:Protein kinase domain-containing protein n=1 Tax=Ephemerocybe angulata TaxID=980116 RepID=A0A8H5B660_9AGAR|nr:hypothetical protein D9611_003802 [Tulosesus angulatus]
MVSDSKKTSAEDRVKAEFRKWDLDTHKEDIWPKCTAIQVTSTESVGIYEDAYLVKIIETHSELGEDPTYAYRAAALPKEITMMLLAGDDCTLPPVGRVFSDRGFLCGYIQPLGATICKKFPKTDHFRNTQKFKVPPSLLPSPQTQISALTELVARLHAKGIIHGDIKPANLITARDAFRLLFCDFGSADIEGSGMGHISDTAQYISPFRAATQNRLSPVRKEDDLYATGIAMWEIASGRVPFEEVDPEFVEHVVAAGFQPNLGAVHDLETRRLITMYLQRGCPNSEVDFRSNEVCVAANVEFEDCVAQPAHTYIRSVHREGCSGEEECETAYHITIPMSCIEKKRCPKCS